MQSSAPSTVISCSAIATLAGLSSCARESALEGFSLRHSTHALPALEQPISTGPDSTAELAGFSARALSERAANYLAQAKKAMARKDLDRILAEDSDYEGVRERLAEVASA